MNCGCKIFVFYDLLFELLLVKGTIPYSTSGRMNLNEFYRMKVATLCFILFLLNLLSLEDINICGQP